MAELHSMARTSVGCCWDLQNLGLFNTDMPLVMDGTSPFLSSLQSDFSTGYLEDALVEFSERSKRRRLMLYTADDEADHQTKISNDLAKSYWNENSEWQISENFSCTSHVTSIHGVSDESISRSTNNMSEETNVITEMKTPEKEISLPETVDSSSSSAKTKSIFNKDSLPYPVGHDQDNKRKKRVITRVVYPFALVKPGGVEGEMTINDINERMLMPPTRPVRHPVGDFACRPCMTADGTGLSGKAVVALTRIYTQGRGTITIIRTKGQS